MLNENLVGIISDTHDNRKMIKRAVDVFNHRGCSIILHAGDYIAPFTFFDFQHLAGSFIGVYGNNDGEKNGLDAKYSAIGNIYDPPYEFDYSGKHFVIMHNPSGIDPFISREDIDVIIYGHLHEIDIRYGRPLVINPGECCGYLTERSTVAVLDISDMTVELIDL